MKMDEGLDTGPEYCRLELETGDMRADDLETALGEMASHHIECLILKIAAGDLCEVWQDDSTNTGADFIRVRLQYSDSTRIFLPEMIDTLKIIYASPLAIKSGPCQTLYI